ncbi:hypothetical protein MKZ38_001588 [Zalerion maritima]|uniref:Elongation factor 1 alpha-like protein n=1 Tax=Zalerion maritima TaxID=339359 RepID=A0AAD5WRT5_9PEZI|nr:hypothetical protein MKZ38_001588 [Zalerion maritima]
MASYDYDYDEHEADLEPMSAEDRAQMDKGLMAVRQELKQSPDLQVTTAQIEDSLWNYYFDVGKSVASLQKTYGVKPKQTPKKQTAPKAKSPMMPAGLEPRPEHCQGRKLMARSESFAHFFSDMPWLNVPEHRKTTFIPPTMPIPGGLPGGAPSKLQALASRRKRKAEEKDVAGPSRPQTMSGEKVEKPTATSVVQKVQRLSIDDRVSTPTPQTSVTEKKPKLEEPDIPNVLVEEPSALACTISVHSKDEHPRPSQSRYPIPYMDIEIPSHMPPLFDFSTPSPDDIALAAQAKVGKKNASPNRKNAAVAPTANMQNLKIKDSTPLPTSKHIDVTREWSRRSNPKNDACFVVVGHVDHGKSTMMGRLMLELGVVDERTMRKHKKEAQIIGRSSFAYAWIMDSGSTERERGVTIDISVFPFETEKTSFTILDAPGHAHFTPAMVTGATYADFGILVVDASTGALESGLKGQTKQHALLLRSMGVNRVIVAINKMDAAGWDAVRYEEIRNQIKGMMKGMKFVLKNISFVPVSGLMGDNLVTKPTNPKAAWYNGPTLIEELETAKYPTEETIRKPLRMDVVDIVKDDFAGLSVHGRVRQGYMQVGDALLLQPSGEKAYVRALAIGNESKDFVVAGQYVRLFLSHIDPSHILTGDTVCDPLDPVPVVRNFQMKALAFEPVLPDVLEVLRGRIQAPAHARPLSLIHPKTGEVQHVHPQLLKQGQFGRLEIRLKDHKVALEKGNRVVLRDGTGRPVAAGLLD